LVDRFRAQGATNVKFIWSPNGSDDPDRDGNHPEDYWPGQEYVDILGFDAYKWTDAEPRRGDGNNRSFEEIVEGPYQRISRHASSKDIWPCEFGTTEPGKATRIRDMFATTRFPRLTGLVYFTENDQRDVRLDSSTQAAQAWREAVTSRVARPQLEFPFVTRDDGVTT
jgi:mannan endo-1,4-beta-mannosidase